MPDNLPALIPEPIQHVNNGRETLPAPKPKQKREHPNPMKSSRDILEARIERLESWAANNRLP